ncbi:MAG: 4-alpha-glucanotransferase [Clostridiales bacterium]|nr:4-alpha-glucanotransferase [Clostridiales bacterium]
MKRKVLSRKSGVLMPIFSLPSKYGIGDFGKESYKFIDLLAKSKQKVWQILPLVQTQNGNSPYSSVCTNSFSPYYISPDSLRTQGLLTKKEVKNFFNDSKRVDYIKLYKNRFSLLEKAFSRFDKNSIEFTRHLKSKDTKDYALFMAIKEKFNNKPFYEWEDALKFRDDNALKEFENRNKDRVLFYEFIQFVAKEEWLKLKAYANKKGIEILGDIPIYVAHDSVDVWKNGNLFKLEKNLLIKKKAGVPPDYFCENGQLWGNPVYDYTEHQKDNFSWWADRVEKALEIYDLVRIDHFRALDRYYEIDANSTNAKNGEWVKVPSYDLFNAIHKKVDKSKIIAEDLGIIDDGVKELIKNLGYPNMKVLSFAFNGDNVNPYLPENIQKNCICYTGTHDNDTLVGLISSLNKSEYETFYKSIKNSLKIMDINCKIDDIIGLAKAIIMLGAKSKAKTFIVPMQDMLFLGSDYRINQPGTIDKNNWSVRFSKKQVKLKSFSFLRKLTKKYNR